VLTVPDGFSIAVWADDVPDARSLTQSDDGTVYVATRKQGAVYALRDADGDGHAEPATVMAKGLVSPNGIVWHDGALYVAEIGRILRYDGVSPGAPLKDPHTVRDDLPTDSHHGWRYIAFGPDGRLYLSIGAPCNVCEATPLPRDGRELETASITRMKADGSDWEMVASGIRNSVGFDWDPKTGKLWFTDNGRDWLGDDTPSCEVNRVDTLGADYGFPYCHAGSVADPEFGEARACGEFVAPVAKVGPHVAPLGIHFYRGEAFPEPWRDAMFVALHGSWNRSEKSGYAVVALDRDGQLIGGSPFVTGFLDGERTLGRPVDLLERPDGSLLVSDDDGGRIWRITPSVSASAR